MHTPGPIDIQSGPDIGCRIDGCVIQSDVAYILCTEHQRLARVAPRLLEALEMVFDSWFDKPSNIKLVEPRWLELARPAIAEAKGK